MVFDIQVTDLYGNVLTVVNELDETVDQIEQYSNVWYTPEVSQDRKGGVTLSAYNPFVQHLIMVTDAGKVVATNGRMIRIKFRGVTRLWGIVVSPQFTSREGGSVVVNIQGPTYKLRHRQLNFSDAIVGTEDTPTHNPSDHTTMQKIVEAAYDTTAQYALNIPDIGVLVENVSGVDAPEQFWTDVQRGSNNWDKLIEVSDSAYGGEFDVVPHDPTEDELPFDTTLVAVP